MEFMGVLVAERTVVELVGQAEGGAESCQREGYSNSKGCQDLAGAPTMAQCGLFSLQSNIDVHIDVCRCPSNNFKFGV
jgi:hypothetical protein